MSSSPCLSGNTYVLDLDLVKSPSRTSQLSSSSPSSTISESSNSPLAIVYTRKARTTRKRPNQTYNEAAALLATAYPNIFSTKHVKKNTTFCTSTTSPLLLDEPSELLLPFRVFDNSGFLLHQPVRDSPGAGFFGEPRAMMMSPSCQSSSSTTTTATWEVDSMEVCEGYREDDPDFNAESMLDEELGEGIDSIMGNLCVGSEVVDGSTRGTSGNNCYIVGGGREFDPWYAHPIGLSLGGRSQFGGLRIGGVRALRRVHNENYQNFPIVDMLQISPRLNINKSSNPNSLSNSESKPNSNSSTKLKLKLMLPNPKPKLNSEDKKKRKNKVERQISELVSLESAKEDSMEGSPIPEIVNSGLKLKLNYEDVLDAWSDRGMPLPEEIAGTEGTDVSAKLTQIDLFSENGGLREASVLRYKEKRRNRLFSNSKKIRYQVRKVNADRRPRMKGRFVRRSNGNLSHHKREK